MVGTKWTEKEILYLKEKYKIKFYSDIAKDLNRSRRSVDCKAEKLGLKSGYRTRGRVLPGKANPNWKGGISKNNYKYAKRTKKKHREKHIAGMKLRYAVKIGKIIRPKICSRCPKYSNRIEGHHEDYSKPLEVIWLCRKCHNAEHKRIRESIKKK